MRVTFSPHAQAEFDQAERYYERQVPGLGGHFRREVQNALKRLQTWPLAAPIESGEIRRLILSRFPYKLLYSIEADGLYVIAFAHQHRAPGYWSNRQKP